MCIEESWDIIGFLVASSIMGAGKAWAHLQGVHMAKDIYAS